MTRYTSGPITIPYPDYREKPYDATIQTTFQTTADEIAAAIAGSTQLIYDTIGTVSAPGELRQNEGTVGSYALAKGFWDPNDGGGDFFSWVVGSAVDDGYYNIVPQGTPSGYWKRLVKGNVINVKGLGARSANPDNGSYINGILSAIGSNKATLYFPKDPGVATTTYAFTTSVSFPSNVHVIIEQGARFSSATVAVVFNSADQITAPIDDQIFSFSSSGSFSFTNGGTVYIKWTGAVGNGSTDDTTALDQLITSLDGTKGKIVLTQPSIAYRFSTGKTWTLSDGTILEIVGEYPEISVQVNAQLWFFSAEARTATTLAANATRKDKSITVTAATGIQEGDIVWIYTSVIAETGWNTYKTDTHLVKSVSGSVVNLETPLNFSYDTSDSGQSVTIYRPAQVVLENLECRFYTSTTRFLFRGIRYGKFKNVRFFDADRAQDLTPAEWSRCVDTHYENFNVEGMLYSTAVNFCRNFRADNVIATECIASIEAASFSDGVSINGLYSYDCDNSVGSHPAFNVSFENVIANDLENTGSMRAAGVVLRNANLRSTVAASSGNVLVSTIEFVDATIYDDYDTTLENVTFDFPNWEFSVSLDDMILVSYGNKLVVHNCKMPGLNCSTLNKPFDILVSDSKLNKVQFRSNARVVNTKFEGDGGVGTWPLYLYGSLPWTFVNCHFKNYEILLYRPVNKLRPFNFNNCYFESITEDLMDPFYTGDNHFVHFTECSFYLCSMAWNIPEVVNANLRVANCHFVTSTTQLDFVTFGIASGEITGGVVDGTPFSWQNPYNHKIIVDHIIIEITTAGGTANSEMNIDVVQTSGSTGDDIFDGIDLNPGTVPVIYDSRNSSDAGTNGKMRSIRMDAKNGDYDWITGRVLVADSTNLVAKYYIFFHRL